MKRDRRIALLDRDGTIIIDKIYLADPNGVEFAPTAIEGLKLLRDAGARFILITNQSGLARGLFSENALAAVHQRLREMLADEGLALDAIYYCPHGPEDNCRCRKPAPGLVEDAMADFGFAPDEAVFIGDGEGDMGAAEACGIKGFRIAPEAAPHFLAAARRALDYFEARGEKERPCT